LPYSIRAYYVSRVEQSKMGTSAYRKLAEKRLMKPILNSVCGQIHYRA